MRIMSFNIRCADVAGDPWQNRISIVARTMLDSGADSIGVQEAHPGWMRSLKRKTKDKYACVGVGRDNGKNRGEYSAVFYLKDKYDALDSGTFWLSQTPDKPSFGWDAACKRVCTWVILQNKESGEKYVHMNSHFDHIGTVARANSVDMIIKKAKEFADLPVVFTADMNVPQGSENYNQFIESGILKDSKFSAPDTMDCCTYHDANPEEHGVESVIDYIMINDHFKALTYKVVTEGISGRYVSDHYPVYADISAK